MDEAAFSSYVAARRARLYRTACLLCGEDIPSLTERVVQQIDDLDDLNRRQAAAFEHAQSSFRWSDRGAHLLAQIRSLRTERSAACERKFGS